MPGQDGFAVIQRLMERAGSKARKDRMRSRCPRSSCHGYDQYAVRAFDVNAVDYLLKPFDLTRVQQTVERVRGRIAARASNSPGTGRCPIPHRVAARPLLRLLNRPQGPRDASVARLIVQAQSRCCCRSSGDLLPPSMRE